jgi:PKD repeat protein
LNMKKNSNNCKNHCFSYENYEKFAAKMKKKNHKSDQNSIKLSGHKVFIIIMASITLSLTILTASFNTFDWKVSEGNESGLIPKASFSENPIWNETWGGSSQDEGRFIWGDGTSLYTAGFTRSFGAGDFDIFLFKCDLNGVQIWNRTWGGSSGDYCYSIWGNGTNIYTVGFTESFGIGESDLLIIKWDSDGNQIWNKTWGGIYEDVGYSTWGKGSYFYTAGYTKSFGMGERDLLIIKWDSDGDQIWNKTWGDSQNQHAKSIWGDDTYLYVVGSGINSLLMTKWDTNGNKIWDRTWGNSISQEGNSIWGDGMYLYTTGSIGTGWPNYSELSIIKWNTEGYPIWNKTWGETSVDIGYSLWGDGSFIYTLGDSYSSGSSNIVIIKWDTSDGKLICNNTWGGPLNDNGHCIWGNGKYLYTTGLSSHNITQYDGNCFIIKWNFNYIPTASFSVSINKLTATFSSQGSEGDQPAIYNWQFGDNSTNSTEKNPIHTYNKTGNYTAILTLVDKDGDFSEYSKNIELNYTSQSTIPTNPLDDIDYIRILVVVGMIILVMIGLKIISKGKPQNSLKSQHLNIQSSMKSALPGQNQISISTKNNSHPIQQPPLLSRGDSQKQKIDEMKQKLKMQQIQQEQALLTKFKRVMNLASEIKQSQAAEMLGITEKELTLKLFEWSEQMPFKIKGEMIVVDDISAFTAALDKQFTEWGIKEQAKDGKIEDIQEFEFDL